MLSIVICFIFQGSIGIKYAFAMGMRVVAIVGPNDKVKVCC